VTDAQSREDFAKAAFAISRGWNALVYCAAVLVLGRVRNDLARRVRAA
jgi:hypothetical protein